MRLPVLSLMLVVFGLTTGEFAIAGILPEVAGDLAVPVPSAGLLVTAYALGMIVGGPVVTVLTARVPRRRLIVGLVGFAVLANLGSALAPGYPMLVVTRFAAGLIVATFFALAIATAVGTAREGRAASAIAQVALGMNLGIVLGTPVGTVVGQHLGWRATFVAVAAIAGLGLLMVLRFVTELPPAATGSVFGELRVLTDRNLLLAIALTALGSLGVVGVFTYIAPLLTDIADFSAAAVPALLLIYGVGAVVGNQLGGRLADRALLPALIGLLTALTIALALFWVGGEIPSVAAVLVFLLGTLAFAVIPGMQSRVISAASAAPTLAIALNAAGYQLAAALAGRLGGWTIAEGPGLRALPLIAAALTATSVALAVYMLRRDRHTATV
ncbi:DHA1 family inner membrane transport protein [Nocardia transvalensis]|uniref:DHA1 family inner membrane transport protein n=1 Tax=Nocardia transvalensis TaxID=37333 RepID=A0A7W9PB97_9NOCA|nr:MFS transporter [Nocardia transvalensis]MBB5912509.1 DHA1 family inner membrane transport protein [Nocardia transvalensis]